RRWPCVLRRGRPGSAASRGLRRRPARRQTEREAGAPARPVAGGDSAAVCFDDLPCHGETEAGPPRPRREEWLEDPLAYVGRDAGARIGDVDLDGAPVGSRGEADLTAGGHGPDRGGEEPEEHPGEEIPVRGGAREAPSPGPPGA